MEMMSSLLARGRISTARVESRADALLHAFDDGFVLKFDAVEVGTRPHPCALIRRKHTLETIR